MPAAYARPCGKRGRTDAADAEAVCEAVSRPTTRFAPVKSAERQAGRLDHKAREFLVRRRTRIVDGMRARLAESGIVIAKGAHNLDRLLATVEAAPEATRPALASLADRLRDTHDRIAAVTARIEAAQVEDPRAPPCQRARDRDDPRERAGGYDARCPRTSPSKDPRSAG